MYFSSLVEPPGQEPCKMLRSYLLLEGTSSQNPLPILPGSGSMLKWIVQSH